MIPAMSEARLKPIAAAEVAVRHLLLMIGFGFIAYVGGSIFAASLMIRIASRMESGPGFFTLAVIDGLWVLLALPLLAHLAARFMPLKPWRTAGVGAGTGALFQLALQYVSMGGDGIIGDVPRLIARLVSLAAGIAITAWAVKAGRTAAEAADAKAKIEAEKKKTQYDEFVKAAESMAERREQVPIAAPPDTKPSPPE
jgi:hypothetical protein